MTHLDAIESPTMHLLGYKNDAMSEKAKDKGEK